MSCAQDIEKLRNICTDELRVFIPTTFFIGTNREKINEEIFAQKALSALSEAIQHVGTPHARYDRGIFWK